MKKTLTALLLGLALAIPTPAVAQDIYVVNQSTNVSALEIADALPAFQAAVDQDFAPVWGTPATLRFEAGSPPKGSWKIYLRDDTGLDGAGGFHYITTKNTPFAVIGTQTNDWQVIFTHELFEMLVDPQVNRLAAPIQGNTFYFVEVADPVELMSYVRSSATGQPVQISDFITPNWYSKVPGKRDFMGKVKKYHGLLPGGYVTIVQNNEWSQIFADGSKKKGKDRT